MQVDQGMERHDILKWEMYGEIPIQRGHLRYKQLQDRLQNLCIAYRDGIMGRQDFLGRIARNLHLGDRNDRNPDQENAPPNDNN